MSRHTRRADLAHFRRAASRTSLLTYLVAPEDPALDGVPLLRRATDSWIAALSVRVRSCINCHLWITDKRNVGLVLLSTPLVAKPTSASICGVCLKCAELPLSELEQAATVALQAAVPGGRFEPPERR